MSERTPQDVLRDGYCRRCGHGAGYHGAGFCTWKTYDDNRHAVPPRQCDCGGWLDKAIAEASDSPSALSKLIRRVERHVDFECGADSRYAFMEEIRVIAGDLAPDTLSEKPGLNVERLSAAFA